MARHLDRHLLREKIEEVGLAKASISTGVGLSTLEKLRAGTYKSQISRKTMGKICGGLRISIDLLFPDDLKKRAS